MGGRNRRRGLGRLCFLRTALLLTCSPFRCNALPSDLDEWGGKSASHVVSDFAVGTIAAGLADIAAAPFQTIKSLVQSGSDLRSMHTKALELLDSKGRPIKEKGVCKIVHVPLPPAEILAKLFGENGLTIVSAMRWSVTGMAMVIFTRLIPIFTILARGSTAAGEADRRDGAAGLMAAVASAGLYMPLLTLFRRDSDLFRRDTAVVDYLTICRTLEHIVASEVFRRAHAESWNGVRWSPLAIRWSFAAPLLHAVLAAAIVPLELRSVDQGRGLAVENGGGFEGRGVGGGWRRWWALKSLEFAVRGGVLHYVLMQGHGWLSRSWMFFGGAGHKPLKVREERGVAFYSGKVKTLKRYYLTHQHNETRQEYAMSAYPILT